MPELLDTGGASVTDPQDIANLFAAYYQEIYASKSQYTIQESQDLIKDIKLPTLSQTEFGYMESEFTEEEVAQAIGSLNVGKASGPNGLPIELYKLCPDKLTKHLLRMFEESKVKLELLRDQCIATLVTIHKEGRPRTSCASYLPISLLNAEPKILEKMLATRLVTVISGLIHRDQSGFMPHRNTALNIRRVQGVMGRADTIQEAAVIVSLDATMAFDTIEWNYLSAVLEKAGFGPQFRRWVRLLYTNPLAQVVVNNKNLRCSFWAEAPARVAPSHHSFLLWRSSL